jgi:dolichol-phosphate mannosyltransferase
MIKTDAPMRLWVVLPIHNEAAVLEWLITEIFDISERQQFKVTVIAVDDGSSDGSGDILKKLQASQEIHVIQHRLNRGLGETIRDGFEAAAEMAKGHDVILRMDADRTHDPKYIPELVRGVENGADIAVASRFVRGGGEVGLTQKRKWISRLANVCFRAFFPLGGIREYTCGYRAYRASWIKRAVEVYGDEFIALRRFGFCCTVEKLVKLRRLGATITEVPFTLRYDRKQGRSKMIFNITVFGYIVMVALYYWPWGGWRQRYQKFQATA